MNKTIYLLLFYLLSSHSAKAQSANQYHLTNDEKIYISTDRYLYETKEYLNYSLFVHRYGSETLHSNKVKVWLENTKGAILDSAFAIIGQKNQFSGRFRLPRKGGMFFIKAQTILQSKFANKTIVSKEIYVQSYYEQKVSVQIRTNKKNYSSSQAITGRLECLKPGGEPLAMNKVICQLMQNGSVIQESILHTNQDGKVNYELQLPAYSDSTKSIFYVLCKTFFRGSPYSASKKLVTQQKEFRAEAFFGHGNTGYIAGVKNKVVIKTKDKQGNPYDIKAILKDSKGDTISKFESFKNGLGSFEFIPKKNEVYQLKQGTKTILVLGESLNPFGINCRVGNNMVKAKIVGLNKAALLGVVATLDNVVIYSNYHSADEMVNFGFGSKKGVLSVQLSYNGKPICQKVLFVGRENMKEIQSNLDDPFYLKDKLNSLEFSHPNHVESRFSVAIVKESNFNQIESKSHNVVSWVYLGSEFTEEIDEPQYYFDDEFDKSSHTLELLMNTLAGSWIKDFNSGKVILNQNVQPNDEIVLKGKVNYRNAWGEWKKPRNLMVMVKNTSISAVVDKSGYYTLSLPATYANSTISLIAKKGNFSSGERYINLNYYIDVAACFNSAQPMVSKTENADSFKFQLSATPNIFKEEYKRTIRTAHPIAGKSIVAGASRSPGAIISGAMSSVNSGAYGGMSFLGSRTNSTAHVVDGVRVRSGSSGIARESSRVTVLQGACLRASGSSFIDRESSAYNMHEITNSTGASFGMVGYSHMAFFSQSSYPLSHYSSYSYSMEYLSFTVKRSYAKRSYSMGPRINKKFTAFWNPFVKTNEIGKSKINLSRILSAGAYVILVEGLDKFGKPFYLKKRLEIRDKLSIDYKLPNYMFLNDTANVQVSVTNYSKNVERIYINIKDKVSASRVIILEPDSTKTVYLPIISEAVNHENRYLYVTDSDKTYFYKNISIPVVQREKITKSILSGDGTREMKVDLSNVKKGSIKFKIKSYSNMNAQLIDMVNRLIRQPYGCFEQVSSANYPNLIALQNMQTRGEGNSQKARQLKNYIYNGYNRLVAYETPQKGFEWYGRNPPHQSLSAYGLLQFNIMKKMGLQVDDNMFSRNLDWLWSQRNEEGGFKFRKGKYGFSRANASVNNAYITYVLSRISDYDLSQQKELISDDVAQKFDAYKLALLANAFYHTGDIDRARSNLEKLNKHFKSKNFKDLKAEQSFVCSYGRPLDLEILGLSLQLAVHLKSYEIAGEIRSVILGSINSRGYFGNTQATVLCLEGLNLYAKSTDGKYTSSYKIWVNNKMVKEYELKDFRDFVNLPINTLAKGMNTIKVETKGKSFPYQLELERIPLEKDKIHPNLGLKVKMNVDSVAIGSFTPMTITIKNKTNRMLGQVVASVGVPACFNIPTEELRQMVKQGIIDYYEIDKEKLHIYLLGMNPHQEKQISINWRVDISGSFNFGNVTAMEYYQPEVFSKVVLPAIKVE